MPPREPGEPHDGEIELVVHPAPGREGFSFGAQVYGLRVGDRLMDLPFKFSRELVTDLHEVYLVYASAELVRSVGDRVRVFLDSARVDADRVTKLSIRSDAE